VYQGCHELLDMEEVERLIDMLLNAKNRKIFILGMGRSGFVARAFALRLMNLGFNVYFLGETITPAAGKGDRLIAISGTGTTKMILTASLAAKYRCQSDSCDIISRVPPRPAC